MALKANNEQTLVEQIPQQGLVFEIASDVYKNSYRPIALIAICTALALMAGICGRAYSIKGKGLNLYMLILAATGTGKNSISESINRILGQIKDRVPASTDFIGPSSFASPQAVIRYLSKNPSIVSHYGEVGLLLQQLCSPKANENAKGLLRLMLDLFSMSGPNGVIRSMVYADKDKNTSEIYRPAFSFVGDSTPSEFFKAFDEAQARSGLIPRFSIFEYDGEIPEANESRHVDHNLIERISTLCAHTLMLNSQGATQEVFLSERAAQAFKHAEAFYLDTVNSEAPEIEKILWTRRNEKAYRIAALLAVGVNPYNPVIDEEQANWALGIEFENACRLIEAFEKGEVGEASSEDVRIKRVIDAIAAYCLKPWPELKSYNVQGHLHEQRIITYTYLHRRLSNTKPFKKQNGQEPTRLIKEAIKTLVERGDLQELSRATLAKDYGFNGLAYMVANPKLVIE